MRLPLKELKKDIISIDKIEETDGIGKINSRFLERNKFRVKPNKFVNIILTYYGVLHG